MAELRTPKFRNDEGVARIDIGVREFECIGASAPFDHPHVYLDMGDDSEIVCPYCSTLYAYDSSLAADQSRPAGAIAAD